jgi:hypothetical protein
MRKITLILFVFILSAQIAFGQQIVNDKYKRRQMESMVITRWGKFKPKWYYILFHNKYRKGEDRRTMLQLFPTIASITITEEQSNTEKEDTDQLYQHALWITSNRTLEPVYHLYYKPRFHELNQEIDMLIAGAQQENVDPNVIDTFQFEQSRLNEQVDILRKGFLEQGQSSKGMEEIEQELKRLKGMVHKYLEHQHTLNKYTNQ